MTWVQIFLRGGCDTLSLVPPISGPDRRFYEDERPKLQIPLTGDNKALPITETLGLHPAAAALHARFEKKELAIVQAVGLPVASRSHFDAQALIETGAADRRGPRDGWLARYLRPLVKPPAAHSVQAMALAHTLPGSFLSCEHAVVVNTLGDFNLAGGRFQEAQRAALRRMFKKSGRGWLDQSATQSLDTIDEFEGMKFGDYTPAKGVEYPKADIGHRLCMLAQVLKQGLRPSVVTIDMGGWDTHRAQGNFGEGHFANLVGQLSEAIDALLKDLSDHATPVRILVLTEFGRRVKENASGGTDHGHGSFMLAIGAGVNGGQVYGTWPGLANEHLFERADLAVTTDYRQVLGEMVLGPQAGLFPGFTAKAPLGIIRM